MKCLTFSQPISNWYVHHCTVRRLHAINRWMSIVYSQLQCCRLEVVFQLFPSELQWYFHTWTSLFPKKKNIFCKCYLFCKNPIFIIDFRQLSNVFQWISPNSLEFLIKQPTLVRSVVHYSSHAFGIVELSNVDKMHSLNY